jgi:hypothetical protein
MTQICHGTRSPGVHQDSAETSKTLVNVRMQIANSAMTFPFNLQALPDPNSLDFLMFQLHPWQL